MLSRVYEEWAFGLVFRLGSRRYSSIRSDTSLCRERGVAKLGWFLAHEKHTLAEYGEMVLPQCRRLYAQPSGLRFFVLMSCVRSFDCGWRSIRL